MELVFFRLNRCLLHLPSFRISEWADTSYKCDTAVLKSDKSVTALVFVRETALYALTSLKSQGDEDWGRGDTVKSKEKKGTMEGLVIFLLVVVVMAVGVSGKEQCTTDEHRQMQVKHQPNINICQYL